MTYDPLGRVLVEIRDDPTVAAITTRIRGGEPAGKSASDEGDARGPGHYVPFVVLVRLGSSRAPRAPVQSVLLAARCYGATYQQASALAGAVADAVHARGHRITSGRAVIFDSFVASSQGTSADPDTGQPHEDITIEVGALTAVLA